MREARPRPSPPHARGADRRPQGDRPAQPPRMVELPDLPLLRAGVGMPVVRRHARHAPRRRPAGLPSLRPSRAGPDALRRLRLGLDRAPRHGHRAPGVRARGQRLPARRRGGRPGARARGLRGGAARRARRHADGGQGPRLPRRRPRRRGRRRRHAALPRLPRRGAHLRARDAARRPRRSRRRRRPRARPDAGARRAHDPLRGRATTPTASWPSELERRRALRYPPFSTLIRVVCSSPRPPARRWRPRRPSASACPTRSARRRSSACAAASAPRSWSRRRTARAAVAQVGAAVQEAAADRAHRAAAFSVDVDPQ